MRLRITPCVSFLNYVEVDVPILPSSDDHIHRVWMEDFFQSEKWVEQIMLAATERGKEVKDITRLKEDVEEALEGSGGFDVVWLRQDINGVYYDININDIKIDSLFELNMG